MHYDALLHGAAVATYTFLLVQGAVVGYGLPATSNCFFLSTTSRKPPYLSISASIFTGVHNGIPEKTRDPDNMTIT